MAKGKKKPDRPSIIADLRKRPATPDDEFFSTLIGKEVEVDDEVESEDEDEWEDE